MKNKFNVKDVVSSKRGEGTVEEYCNTSDGKSIQYRVRCDMSDYWLQESEIKLVNKPEPEPSPAPPAPPVK